MYFIGLRPWKYIQPSRGTNPTHCKDRETTNCIHCTCTCVSCELLLCAIAVFLYLPLLLIPFAFSKLLWYMYCTTVYTMYMYMYSVHVMVVYSVWDMYRTRAVCTCTSGGTIPCTVKTMRHLSCTDRPYKATARLALAPEYSTYCTPAVRCKVLYAWRCTYSTIA